MTRRWSRVIKQPPAMASLFEAAIRGLYRLDSSFWTEEEVFDWMCVTVEIHEEPTTRTVKIGRLKQWIKSRGKRPREQAKKEELGGSCLGPINETTPTRAIPKFFGAPEEVRLLGG